MSLFLLVYFSHMLILLITFAVAILLPLAGFHVEKEKNKLLITNQEGFFNRLKVVGISLIPAGALTALYLIKVDSLEEAGRMDLGILLGWLVDIRPMLTLCMCKPWIDFTHILLGLFVFMILVNLYILVKENIHAKDGKLHASIPAPRFNIIWFLLFFGFTLVYLIVPNANILPERLIILVFVFLGFWLATQKYPKWVQYIFVSILVTTHVTFAFLHTKHMRPTSDQISKMSEVSEHIEEGSLLLPFNYAYHHNWLHMHSPGYFGSDKPVAVIENYEGALQWFPVKWNYEGPYVLDKISVWAADNRKLIDSMYLNADNPDVFSMPKKDGSSAPIPYVVIFGKVAEEHQESYLKIMSVLDLSYELSFDNGFCKLYKQITAD